MDGCTDADIRTAATVVAGHGSVNVIVVWLTVGFEQSSRTHDLACLTVATLRHIVFHPCGLQRVQRTVASQTFNCRDLAADCGHRQHAGAGWCAIDVDGARPALCDATAKLGALELQLVA